MVRAAEEGAVTDRTGVVRVLTAMTADAGESLSVEEDKVGGVMAAEGVAAVVGFAGAVEAGAGEAETGGVVADEVGAGESMAVVLLGAVGETGEEEEAEKGDRAIAACCAAIHLAIVFVRLVVQGGDTKRTGGDVSRVPFRTSRELVLFDWCEVEATGSDRM